MAHGAKFLEYLLVRIAITLFTVFLLVTAIFLALRIIPGDPVEMILGEYATEQQIEEVRHQLGLDKPLYIQYIDYLKGLVTGDLGQSLNFESVSLRISRSIGPTIDLAIAGTITGLLIGVSLGLLATLKLGSWTDRFIRIIVLSAYSVPVFVLGLVLQILFVFWFPNLLPTSGLIESEFRPQAITGLLSLDSVLTLNFPALVSSLSHLILPTFVLGISLAAPITNLTRENTAKILYEDFILMSKTMGIPKNRIILRHAFRNTLLPLITYTGLSLSALLGGAVLIETIFSRPGLGLLLVTAISARDFNLIQGIVIYWAFIISAISFITDIAYAFVDPRVKHA